MLRSRLVLVRQALRRVTPFVLSALAGAALALFLMPRPHEVAQELASATPEPSPTATFEFELPTPVPLTATPLPLPEDILSQRLREQELAVQQLTSSLYILKAAAHIQAGRLALRDNNLQGVERSLAAAWSSLDYAAAAAGEVERSAIRNLQQRLSYIQDALHVRPEDLDNQMADLWQSLMALINNQP